MLAMSWVLDKPLSARSVLLYVIGSTERAAGGLKQIGPRIFGFQNSGLSTGPIQERSTAHTKPFLPFTAVSYPCSLSTRIVASPDTAAGAALRASAISAC